MKTSIIKPVVQLLFILVALLPAIVFAQNREDDPLPIVTPATSLHAFTGWTKTDIGKWTSAKNAIPTYVNYLRPTMPLCEEVLRFELAKVEFKGKEYYCLVKFKRHIYGYRREKLEYGALYWLFDLNDTRRDSVGNVETVVYKTTLENFMLGYYKPVTWSDVRKDLKIEMDKKEKEELYKDLYQPQFFIQNRFDKKNDRFQFIFGSTKDPIFGEEDRYNYSLLCTGEEENEGMKIMYYEISKDAYLSFLKPIL